MTPISANTPYFSGIPQKPIGPVTRFGERAIAENTPGAPSTPANGIGRKLKASGLHMARYFVSGDLVKDLLIGTAVGTVLGLMSGVVTIIGTVPSTIAIWSTVSLIMRGINGFNHPDAVLGSR